MEFEFNVRDSILGHRLDDGEFGNIYIVSGKQLSPIERLVKRSATIGIKNFYTVMQRMGTLSAKAQRLPQIITTYDKMRISDHNTYILVHHEHDQIAIGFIRVGRKHLFLNDRYGRHHEVEPLCVLDFYVHEKSQRKGHGLRLFKAMLETEAVRHPSQLAIDKPSQKFLNFLKKHYSLSYDIQQVNNYVVFEGFFRRENLDLNKYPAKRYSSALTSRPAEEASIFDRHKRKQRPPENAQAVDIGYLESEHVETDEGRYLEPEIRQEEVVEEPPPVKDYEFNNRRDSGAVANALFNEYDYKRHEFNGPPAVKILDQTEDLYLKGRHDYQWNRSRRQSNAERTIQSAGARGAHFGDSKPLPRSPYHNPNSGDYAKPSQPLNPLQINNLSQPHNLRPVRTPSQVNSDHLLSSSNNARDYQRRSSGHQQPRSPLAPPYNSDTNMRMTPPRERIQLRSGHNVSRGSNGSGGSINDAIQDTFSIQGARKHGQQRLARSSGSASQIGKLPSIAGETSHLASLKAPNLASWQSSYNSQTKQLQDPYFDQLRRVTESSGFRDRIREVKANSGWNVFGVPRSYTTYGYK